MLRIFRTLVKWNKLQAPFISLTTFTCKMWFLMYSVKFHDMTFERLNGK